MSGLQITTKGRYQWLVVDGLNVGLIIMVEKRCRRGRLLFELPGEYAEFMNLRGIELKPASYTEAAEYLAISCQRRAEQLTPEPSQMRLE